MTSGGKCGQMTHSNSNYGENFYMCWGGENCATPKGIMVSWCECPKHWSRLTYLVKV